MRVPRLRGHRVVWRRTRRTRRLSPAGAHEPVARRRPTTWIWATWRAAEPAGVVDDRLEDVVLRRRGARQHRQDLARRAPAAPGPRPAAQRGRPGRPPRRQDRGCCGRHVARSRGLRSRGGPGRPPPVTPSSVLPRRPHLSVANLGPHRHLRAGSGASADRRRRRLLGLLGCWGCWGCSHGCGRSGACCCAARACSASRARRTCCCGRAHRVHLDEQLTPALHVLVLAEHLVLRGDDQADRGEVARAATGEAVDHGGPDDAEDGTEGHRRDDAEDVEAVRVEQGEDRADEQAEPGAGQGTTAR